MKAMAGVPTRSVSVVAASGPGFSSAELSPVIAVPRGVGERSGLQIRRAEGAVFGCDHAGQVTTVGPILYKGLNRLHFAGEHASYKFVGYMEGALNIGAAVAQRLAQRDGVIKQTTTQKIQSTSPTKAPALVK